MTTRYRTATVLSLTVFLLGAAPLAQAACEGEKVDKTTADFAMQKAKAAGYQKVTGLKKGCDSVWHGKAVKGSETVNIMISPKGEVAEEGN